MSTQNEPVVEFDETPVEVLYCGVCGLPAEYCKNGPNFDLCKPWLIENAPELYPELGEEGVAAGVAKMSVGEGGEEKKEDGAPVKKKKVKGAKKQADKTVTISTSMRNRRKTVTVVIGLENHDLKLKDAAKKLGKKCACGSSVGDQASNPQKKEIVIQGDVAYDMPDILEELFSIPAQFIKRS